MDPFVMNLVVGLAVVVVIGVGIAALLARFYRTVEQGRALIINRVGREATVTFTGGVVLPIVHRAEVMDISVKTIVIDRRGKLGLICRDNIRADINVTFFVRVNKTSEDVLKVAQMVGCERASHQQTLEDLFQAKFSEALKTVGKRLDFEDLYKERDHFKDQIIEVIGKDLNGYVLDDAAIDNLEQTPLEMLDPENILDAVGIRKITEITTQQNVSTNELRRTEEKAITKQNVEAREAILALQRQQAEAEAKQKRGVAEVQAHEEAETKKVQAQEHLKSELARVKGEEELAVAAEGRNRQVMVAQKNRERVVAIETERVEKDRVLEVINRERETEVSRISKEKDVEEKKREIADIVRGRIAVERTVAEEEERIKDVRAIADAKRKKEVAVTDATAAAEQSLIVEIKAAEAKQEVAKFAARERLTLSEAELEAADKLAKAKIRLAEGAQAEGAAAGLAQVKIKEANALAIEKEGLAQAKVELEKMAAQAAGEEKKGLAKVRVAEQEAQAVEKRGAADAKVVELKLLAEAKGLEEKGTAQVRVQEADAQAIEKRGLAEATAIRERALAEAKGLEEKGLAEVKVRQADAVAIEKRGVAEALALREKALAEAQGIAEKLQAMKVMDPASREHEEFRLRLQKDREVELAQVSAREKVASHQAAILKEAFHEAKINIVGGDGQFFDRFVKAISLGQAVDGAFDHSQTLGRLFGEYMDGRGSLPADLRQILSRPALDGETLKNVSISALIGQLMRGADGPMQAKLRSLIDRAKELGVDEISAGGAGKN